jgi:hypothetical protein
MGYSWDGGAYSWMRELCFGVLLVAVFVWGMQ